MNRKSIHIAENLVYLRKAGRFSIEEVAEKIGVSRQAVSKWEAGETIPDIVNCDALAELYDVSVDDLLHYDSRSEKMAIAPKGKHIFGTTVLGERGQVVIPKQARDIFGLKAGDMLMVLGDETPGARGLALVCAEEFMQAAKEIMEKLSPSRGDE